MTFFGKKKEEKKLRLKIVQVLIRGVSKAGI